MLHRAHRMSSRRLVAALAFLLPVALTACSSSGNTPIDAGGKGGAGGADGGAGRDGSAGAEDASGGKDGTAGNTDATTQADCAAVHGLPPIVAIVDATTGTPICDPTFTVEWPDGSAVGSKDGMPYGCGQTKDFDCPGPSADGGSAPCAFALLALSYVYGMNLEVEVSKPGYETTTVPVTSGLGGCAYVPASHPIVKLHPLADAAAADGG
jgi:hypothetical protein